ncbi:MAG: IS6 family transposase [Mesorhizobium sp.]|nr:MAG: IS6 family transposase [Mesorhizobium sp.]
MLIERGVRQHDIQVPGIGGDGAQGLGSGADGQGTGCQKPPQHQAARRLLTRFLKQQGTDPKRMITDKLRSYGAARRQVMRNVDNRSTSA